MTKISERHIKAWSKFNAELDAYRNQFGADEYACLYEDAYTTRYVKNFSISKTGIVTWTEHEMKVVKGQWTYVDCINKEKMLDEDDAKDWLTYWKACFRRAKRYDSMPAEVLDAIQDGERADIDDEE